MFYSDDPLRDFERYDMMQELELEKRPVCDCCGEPITDSHYYDLFDSRVCSECLEKYCDDNFKVDID